MLFLKYQTITPGKKREETEGWGVQKERETKVENQKGGIRIDLYRNRMVKVGAKAGNVVAAVLPFFISFLA